jgi:hypothetical protein
MSLAFNQLDSPICVTDYGLAHVADTKENIQHLMDVQSSVCLVPQNSCARVSNLRNSSIFACNYVGSHVKRNSSAASNHNSRVQPVSVQSATTL